MECGDIEDISKEKCKDCTKGCNKPKAELYDAVIIGAGVIGCSIARELAKYQLKVLVVDKSSDVSQGASKSNSGIIHAGFDDQHGTLKSKLCHTGNHMFRQLNEELNFGFRNIGSLVLAFSKDEVSLLEELLENGNRNGVEGLKILTREETIAREPHVNPQVYASLYSPCAGIVSPYEYTIALAENAKQNGVDFLLSHEVTDIQMVSNDTHETGITSATGNHFLTRMARFGLAIRSKIVVNAAGVMADRIAAMVGANNFYIVPRKGEYVLLEKSQGHLARHVLFPVPSKIRGKGILVSPTFHGNLLLGPTSRGSEESCISQREVLKLIITSARHSVPGFDASMAITSYSGLRAKSSRSDFIIEESITTLGFINVAGIDSPGLTSSPAIAKMASDLIRSALFKYYNDHVHINPKFNPYRKPIIIKKTDAFKGSIDNDDPALNIICRCEKVTEAEIVDAIRRPIGGRDTDSVKRRTR
ncbi:hypothetical protein HDV01_000224 [Terramyces sp. JEL0728]|nr:hypothetical protein HDV01_000224 [Terramyces sp. JEL0728]